MSNSEYKAGLKTIESARNDLRRQVANEEMDGLVYLDKNRELDMLAEQLTKYFKGEITMKQAGITKQAYTIRVIGAKRYWP